jgi:hypothetical protein
MSLEIQDTKNLSFQQRKQNLSLDQKNHLKDLDFFLEKHIL